MSAKEIALLRSMFDRVLSTTSQNVNPRTARNRRKRLRRKQRQNGLAPVQLNPVAPSVPSGRRRNRRNRTIGPSDGSVRVKRTEFLKDIKLTGTAAKGSITLKPDNFSWLKGLSKSFDRIVWHSCVIEFKPYASAMNSGGLAIGADWNFKGNQDRATALACTPVMETPVYVGKTMVLPSRQLMSRSHYVIGSTSDADAAPCALIYHCASDTSNLYAGDLFIHYDVTLSGTSA